MLGDHGEAIAADWYRQHGYDIIAANVQAGRNELDLICRTAEEIVFVEVKTGRSDEYGAPLYRVDRYKVRALIYAAQRWLLGHPQGDRGIRFDVISIETDRTPPAIDHRPAAFTADDA
jgi:putative endonuclease